MMEVSADCASVLTRALCPTPRVRKLSLITSPTRVQREDMFTGHQEQKPLREVFSLRPGRKRAAHHIQY